MGQKEEIFNFIKNNGRVHSDVIRDKFPRISRPTLASRLGELARAQMVSREPDDKKTGMFYQINKQQVTLPDVLNSDDYADNSAPQKSKLELVFEDLKELNKKQEWVGSSAIFKSIPQIDRKFITAALPKLFCLGLATRKKFRVGDKNIYQYKAIVTEFYDRTPLKKALSVKHDINKPDLTLFFEGFPRAIKCINKVGEFGIKAKGYKRDSWKHLEDGEFRYKKASLRHLMDVFMGMDRDEESGLPCLDFVAWNLLAMIELRELNKGDGK